MWRDRSMGLAVAVLALISCSKSANQQTVAAPSEVMPADAAAQAKSQDIVVSGTRMARDELYQALPVAPPPPPPPAPGMYPTWSPPYHDVGRDKFSHVDENPFKMVQRSAGLDLLDRRRHRVLFVGARVAEPECAAAAGRGAHRGDGQLLPLRLRAADGRPSSRSAPTSR